MLTLESSPLTTQFTLFKMTLIFLLILELIAIEAHTVFQWQKDIDLTHWDLTTDKVALHNISETACAIHVPDVGRPKVFTYDHELKKCTFFQEVGNYGFWLRIASPGDPTIRLALSHQAWFETGNLLFMH